MFLTSLVPLIFAFVCKGEGNYETEPNVQPSFVSVSISHTAVSGFLLKLISSSYLRHILRFSSPFISKLCEKQTLLA